MEPSVLNKLKDVFSDEKASDALFEYLSASLFTQWCQAEKYDEREQIYAQYKAAKLLRQLIDGITDTT